MYDFKMLSDYDFELLTQDLLQKAMTCRLESFKKGRDKGIDLRYTSYKDKSTNTIIQCKHYANSSFSNLKSNLKRQEYDKIKALKPSKYILVTSLGLTPMQKDELLNILNPFCLSPSDIFCKEELNALLRRYPEVEKGHYKLWFTSTAVQDRILHSDVYTRSEINLEKALTNVKLYVQNKAYFKAIDILETSHCCIISGIPGIGKTTLAEMLLIRYLEGGYEVIKISQNIKEALDIYSSSKKQIFLYDDFLGQTGLSLLKNEDDDILTLMNYIAKGSSSRFILTTREYILNQAKDAYESFERSNLDFVKCTLVLDDYNKHDKARILFNHLYYNDLPQPYLENLIENDITKIVNHKNYNPRIIEIMTKSLLPQDPGTFYDCFMNNLENPTKIWEHAFSKHISQESRNLLVLLTSLPFKVDLDNLKQIYSFYNEEKSRLYNREFSEQDLNNALKELEGSFISIDQKVVSFQNPSVRDFMENYILENEIEFKILCDTAMCFEQCISLYDLSRRTEHILLIKYSDSYAEAILDNIISFEIRFMNNFIGARYFFNLRSVTHRVIIVMEINQKLKNRKITDYLCNDFFYNLHINFKYYSTNISDCIELLRALTKRDFSVYSNPSLIKDIIEYAIEEIKDNHIEELEDFEIVDMLLSEYPGSISESVIEEIAEVFSEFYPKDVQSVYNWSSVEVIEEYSNKLEELGELFAVNVDDALEYLEEKAENMPIIDEDRLYEEYRDESREPEFDDGMVRDMFDVLLEDL